MRGVAVFLEGVTAGRIVVAAVAGLWLLGRQHEGLKPTLAGHEPRSHGDAPALERFLSFLPTRAWHVKNRVLN